MDAEIRGIVLAAGRSRRMGQPKALLPAAGETFLRRVVETLRAGGCAEVVVVVRPAEDDAEAARVAAAARRLGARVVETPADAREQVHSLRAGLRSLGGQTAAVVVSPVDLPLVNSNVVSALIAAFLRSDAPVVLPAHAGRHGHPVLFSRAVFADLFRDPLPEGARTVVHAYRTSLVEVPVDDAGVLSDIDTPADFRRLVGRER